MPPLRPEILPCNGARQVNRGFFSNAVFPLIQGKKLEGWGQYSNPGVSVVVKATGFRDRKI